MKRSLLIILLALTVAIPAALAAGGTRIALKSAKAFPAAKGSARSSWLRQPAPPELPRSGPGE